MRRIDADALMEAINTWPKFGVDERCRIVPWNEGYEPYIHLRDTVIAITGMSTIEPEQRWIPCSERLPEHSERYLVTAFDGTGRRITVVPYHPQNKTWTLTGRMAYWKVLAWMPLPKGYEG